LKVFPQLQVTLISWYSGWSRLHDIHFLMDVLSLQSRLAAAQILLQGGARKKAPRSLAPTSWPLQALFERIAAARYCRARRPAIITVSVDNSVRKPYGALAQKR